MDTTRENDWREAVRAATAARRVVKRDGLELIVDTARPGETPRVLAFFDARDLTLGGVVCPYCNGWHEHRLPSIQPLYLMAPCSRVDDRNYYLVVPMTAKHARRLFPEVRRTEERGA